MSALLLIVLASPALEARVAGDYERAYTLLMAAPDAESAWEAARLAADLLRDRGRARAACDRVLELAPESPDARRARALLKTLPEASMRPPVGGGLSTWLEANPAHPEATLAAIQTSQSMETSAAIDFVERHRGGAHDWLISREIARRQLVAGRYLSAWVTVQDGGAPGAEHFTRRAVIFYRLLPAGLAIVFLGALAWWWRRRAARG